MAQRLAPLLALLSLCACSREAGPQTTSSVDVVALERGFPAMAARARPGDLQAAVMDLTSGDLWLSDPERRAPLGRLANVMVAAAVLDAADHRRLSLDETITLQDSDLSPPPSPVAEAWPAASAYTVRELLERAVQGDPTASDVLMHRIGGPGAVTAWLTEKGVSGVRVDRYQRDIAVELAGLRSFDPAWRSPPVFAAQQAAQPPAIRRAALAALLVDPRDTMTAQGALSVLSHLQQRDLLSPASTAALARLLEASQGAGALRQALPAGALLTEAWGDGASDLGVTTASDDIGLVTFPHGRRFAIVVLLSGSTGDPAQRRVLIADTARLLLHAAR